MVPLIAILFLSVKATLWLWTWNTASRDTGTSSNWLLLHHVFPILFGLFSQREDNLPAFSVSPAVTPLHLPRHDHQKPPLTECWVCIRQKRQSLHASLQGAPARPNFLEIRKPRLQEADFLSTVSNGPRKGRKVTGTRGKHLHITKIVKAF